MISKVALLSLVAVAVAIPARLPSDGYQFSQPQQQTYQQPQQSYSQAPSRNQNSYSQPQQSYGNDEKEEGMPFNFAYAVQDEYTGNDFSHASQSDGQVTEGEYRVLLPDGRTQIVTYTADHENGYRAEVTYEGEARPYEPQQNSNEGYQPQASFQQPQQQSYQPPQQQSYQQPQQQSYQQPQQQSYQQPQQSYSRPSNSYGASF